MRNFYILKDKKIKKMRKYIANNIYLNNYKLYKFLNKNNSITIYETKTTINFRNIKVLTVLKKFVFRNFRI